MVIWRLFSNALWQRKLPVVRLSLSDVYGLQFLRVVRSSVSKKHLLTISLLVILSICCIPLRSHDANVVDYIQNKSQ